MKDSFNYWPFLSENARGEEAGKLETATRPQKSSNRFYVVEVSKDKELLDCIECFSKSEAKKTIQDLWYSFFCDECEYNDWELMQTPTGFTNGYTDFMVLTEVEFNEKEAMLWK